MLCEGSEGRNVSFFSVCLEGMVENKVATATFWARSTQHNNVDIK